MIGGGDTPQQTLWRWGLNGQAYPLIGGYVSKGEDDHFHAFVYTDENLTNGVAVFNADGKRMSPGVEGFSWFEQTLCEDLSTALELQVESVILVECPVSVNETIENWNEYVAI